MTTETIWGKLPGEPAFGSNHQGCRRIRRGEPLPDGWQVVRQGNIYDYIKPISELEGVRGGSKQLFIKLHREEILEYYGKHGPEATRNRFMLKTETLEDIIVNERNTDATGITRLDKIETRLEIFAEDNRCLREDNTEFKELFFRFQEAVASQVAHKILLPLLQRAIQLDDSFVMQPPPNMLSPQDLPLKLKWGIGGNIIGTDPNTTQAYKDLEAKLNGDGTIQEGS
jgi:hypothetical protein